MQAWLLLSAYASAAVLAGRSPYFSNGPHPARGAARAYSMIPRSHLSRETRGSEAPRLKPLREPTLRLGPRLSEDRDRKCGSDLGRDCLGHRLRLPSTQATDSPRRGHLLSIGAPSQRASPPW